MSRGTATPFRLRDVPGPLWALLFGTVLNKVTGFLQLFLAFYLTRRGFSPTQVGLALAALAGGGILGTVGAGSLADRMSARAIIAASMTASGVLTASVAFASRHVVICAVLALAGAANQASRPAVSSLLASLTPEAHRVVVFALYRLSFNVGLTIAPLLGALLITRASFSWLLVGDGVTSVAFGIVALLALPKGRTQPMVAHAAASPGSYRTVLADRRFRWFLVALFLSAAVYVQHVSTLPLHLEKSGSAAGIFGILIAINAFLVLVAELPVTRVVQRWSPRLTVAGGFALVALGLTLYAGPTTLPWLVLATVVWSAGEIIATPTAMAHPTQIARPDILGRYVGLAEGIQTLGFAVGPIIGTVLFSRVAGGVWWACGVMGAAAALAAARGMRTADTTPSPAVDGLALLGEPALAAT